MAAVKRKLANPKQVVQRAKLRKRGRWGSAKAPNFSCLFCGKVFKTYAFLVAHMPKHTREKPFECEECGATFSFGNGRYVHMQGAHRGRTYECDLCGVVYSAPSNLRTHKRTVHQVVGNGRGRKKQVGGTKKLKAKVDRKRIQSKVKGLVNKEPGSDSAKKSLMVPSQLLNLVKGLDRVVNQKREGPAAGEKEDTEKENPPVNRKSSGSKVSNELVSIVPFFIISSGLIEEEQIGGNINDFQEELGKGQRARNEHKKESELTSVPIIAGNGDVQKVSTTRDQKQESVDPRLAVEPDIGNHLEENKFLSEEKPPEKPELTSASLAVAKPEEQEYEDPIAKIIASLNFNPGPTVVKAEKPQKLLFPCTSKVPPKNPDYPEMVLVDPVTQDIVSLDAAQASSGNSVGSMGKEEHPPNLYFRVNGKVEMPVFNLTLLHALARRNRQRELAVDLLKRTSKKDQENSAPIKTGKVTKPKLYGKSNGQLSYLPKKAAKPKPQQRNYKILKTNTKQSKSGMYQLALSNPALKPHSCSKCGARFRLKCHLICHLKAHQNRNNGQGLNGASQECQFCGCKYSLKSSLIRHIIAFHLRQPDTNSTGKAIHCPYCSYKGNLSRPDKGLYIHINEHLQRKSTVIVTSQNTNASAVTLTKPKHGKSSGSKKKQCQVKNPANHQPGKILLKNRKLAAKKILKKVSSVKKLCKCQICNVGFRLSSELKLHLLQHKNRVSVQNQKNQKPRKVLPKNRKLAEKMVSQKLTTLSKETCECQFCGRCFNYPYHLKQHILGHIGERPYGCPLCDVRFTREDNRLTHLVNIHCRQTTPSGGFQEDEFTCCFCPNEHGIFPETRTSMREHLLQSHKRIFSIL